MKRLILFNLAFTQLFFFRLSAEIENHGESAALDYQLHSVLEAGTLNLDLSLISNRSLSGFVAYLNPETNATYENIPLERFELTRGETARLPLISFPASHLEEMPLGLKVFLAPPANKELDKAAKIFALIEENENRPIRVKILLSEFEQSLKAWSPSRNAPADLSSNFPQRPISTGSPPRVRNEHAETAETRTKSGTITLDNRLRGLAIISLPNGE